MTDYDWLSFRNGSEAEVMVLGPRISPGLFFLWREGGLVGPGHRPFTRAGAGPRVWGSRVRHWRQSLPVPLTPVSASFFTRQVDSLLYRTICNFFQILILLAFPATDNTMIEPYNTSVPKSHWCLSATALSPFSNLYF